MHHKTLIVFTLQTALLLPLLLLISCSQSIKDKDKRTVFRYNEMATVTSLDPAAASNFENIWPVNQLFNGLVKMSDSLKVIPSIAKSWEISEDGKTYTFYLRKDVYFHNHAVFPNGRGRKVIAKDFVFSFNRLFDPKVSTAMSLLENINQQAKNSTRGFEAFNDSTFRIHLKTAFSPFLGILTMKLFSVVPVEAINKFGEDFRNHPVGTGPFQFKFWEEGSQLALIKNDNYFEWEGKNRLPYLDAVAVSFVKDKETAFMKLLMGEIDMLSGMDAFNPDEVLDAEGKLKAFYQNKFKFQSLPYLKTDYFGILVDTNLSLVKNSPLKLKAIRQAINYAFDRVKLVKYFRHNIGTPACQGFIPPGLPAYAPDTVKGYTYNPDKVNQLLQEAGFPGGKGLPEISLHTTSNYLEILESFQSQLQQNGIKIKISVDQHGELIKAINNNTINCFKKSWVCDYPSEENFMCLFYSKNFSPGGFNYTHYSNAQFDRLYEQAKNEQDENKRIQLYQQMDRLIIEDAPVVPLYYDQVVRLVSNAIVDLKPNAMNMLNLVNVKKQNINK